MPAQLMYKISPVKGTEFGVPAVRGSQSPAPMPRPAARPKTVPDPAARWGDVYGPLASERFAEHPNWATHMRELGYVEFGEVPAVNVQTSIRGLADHAVKLASDMLYLPSVPTVRWYARAASTPQHTAAPTWLAGKDIRGFALSGHPHELWIRVEGAPRRLFEVIGHEVAHVAQAQADPAAFCDPYRDAALEADADDFGARLVAWLDAVPGGA
jgi:hypothetical protein